MNIKFLKYLVDPITKESLQLYSIKEEASELYTALLYSTSSFYPVIEGVPTMFKNHLPESFYTANREAIDSFFLKFPNLKTSVLKNEVVWSFSNEWEYFTENKMQTTWGITLEERFERFLYENEIEESQIKDKLILDAGCGNGTHTENIANHGGLIVGIDYSTSVYIAEKRRKNENVLFVRGDLQNPPFPMETFDIVFSNGVIHHTPDTLVTFKSIIPIVKSRGSFYVWLYNRQGGIVWSLKRRFFDLNRVVICRMHKSVQNFMVNLYTNLIWYAYKLLHISIGQDYKTLKLNMWDSITPRWRHYHEPSDVWKWYLENGFLPPKFTSWDTMYGYGVLGFKKQ